VPPARRDTPTLARNWQFPALLRSARGPDAVTPSRITTTGLLGDAKTYAEKHFEDGPAVAQRGWGPAVWRAFRRSVTGRIGATRWHFAPKTGGWGSQSSYSVGTVVVAGWITPAARQIDGDETEESWPFPS